MKARDTLMARADIPDDEVDDIVAIAARLKDEDPARIQGATPEEVAQVAAELDIEPEYVQAAIEKWRTDNAEAAQAAVAAKKAADKDKKATASRRKTTFMAAICSIIILMMITGGLATLGAVRVNGAHHQVVMTHSQLSVVLDRQATLAPQLVALGGGDTDTLTELATEVGSASDMETRLDKSKQLGIAMAKGLSAKPGTLSEADAQIRLNLQHEVTGTQNRITTEARRYRAAQAEHKAAAAGFTGRLAIGYGLAESSE